MGYNNNEMSPGWIFIWGIWTGFFLCGMICIECSIEDTPSANDHNRERNKWIYECAKHVDDIDNCAGAEHYMHSMKMPLPDLTEFAKESKSK